MRYAKTLNAFSQEKAETEQYDNKKIRGLRESFFLTYYLLKAGGAWGPRKSQDFWGNIMPLPYKSLLLLIAQQPFHKLVIVGIKPNVMTYALNLGILNIFTVNFK